MWCDLSYRKGVTNMSNLYHFSENPEIRQFSPRPSPSETAAEMPPMVWAIHESRVYNYLLPRDCPRISFYSSSSSTPEEIERLMGFDGGCKAVIAFEAAWVERIRKAELYRYTMPSETFTPYLNGAGYWLSHEMIIPIRCEKISDLLGELIAQNVEVRIVASLWPLHDAIKTSSMGFSCIRMKYAQARMKSNRLSNIY